MNIDRRCAPTRELSVNDRLFVRSPRDYWSLAENYFRIHGFPMPGALMAEVHEMRNRGE